jgi:flavodoxin
MTRRESLSVLGGVVGLALSAPLCALSSSPDAVSGATVDRTALPLSPPGGSGRVLVVLVSWHHRNTAALARVMAHKLGAVVKAPEQVTPQDIGQAALIGLGSGIYDQQHHCSIQQLVAQLPPHKRVFIFSTSGVSRQSCLQHSLDDPHTVLRTAVQVRQCTVVDEFNCVGWNTNLFLALFGGMNKGRPNEDDLQKAREFAAGLQA